MTLLAGCNQPTAAVKTEQTLTVAVASPVVRKVTDYVDFTGRTEAVDSVDIKARVSGYLVYIGFQPGAVVTGDESVTAKSSGTVGILAPPSAIDAAPKKGKKGDLLFIIDPRPYEATLEQARSQLKLAEAQFKLAKADYARAQEVSKTPGAISKADVDKYAAAEEQAAAAVNAATANLDRATLDVEFTRITAPVSGKTSWTFLTLGNLVTKDTTLLTTIVSEAPMYVYFDVDERTILRLRELMREGKLKSTTEGGSFPVYVGLANEKGHPHKGWVDFINNRVDASTGTITVRGVFENAKPKVGPRPLLPGQFVRVRMPLGAAHESTLVAEKAFGSDQGQKFLLVVDAKDTVQYRRVKLGPLEEDGLRVVTEGIDPADRVIVSGLQEVRPRMQVRTEKLEMPRTSDEAPEQLPQ
jgi:multidrug efflux system membrane fusion protein